MKRISYIILFMLLANTTVGQMYIHFNTGMSFSTSPYIHRNRVVTDNVIDLFRIKFNYGNGLNLALSAGYQINENFSVEFLASTALFTASSSHHNWEKYFIHEYDNLHLSGLNGDAKMTNASVHLAPLLMYSIRLGKIQPYIKAGLNLLSLRSTYTNDYTYRYVNDQHEPYLERTSLKRLYTGSIHAGFRGNAGLMYQLTDKLMLSAEFIAVNSAYRFKESETVRFNVDGSDLLDTLEENPEKFTGDEVMIDYSHIGFNLGIRYNLK